MSDPHSCPKIPFSSDADYLRRKFREDVTDASTGLGLQALKANAWNMLATMKDREAWCLVKAHLFEMICDRMSIGVSAHDSWGNPGLVLVSSWIADKESAGTVLRKRMPAWVLR